MTWSISREIENIMSGSTSPFDGENLCCVFQSKVDSGHWSSDLRCIQQEAEDSVENEALFQI